MRYLVPLLLALLASPALAIEPECVTPDEYDEALHVEYDATSTIRFCTPTMAESEDGTLTPILMDSIITCTITANAERYVDGVLQQSESFVYQTEGPSGSPDHGDDPGEYVVWPVPSEVGDAGDVGSISITCTNNAGTGAPVVASNARFRAPTSTPQPTPEPTPEPEPDPAAVPGVPTLLR